MPWPRCSTSTTAVRKGEWIPNEYGGNENLEAIDFIKEFNEVVYDRLPGLLHGGRGVHRLDRGHDPHLSGWAWVWVQVGHGLDARHADVFFQGAYSPKLSSQRPDLLHAVRLQRKFHPARFPTTRWSTARDRCCERCPEMTGRNSRTCAAFRATCILIPARSCFSWAAELASGPGMGPRPQPGLAPGRRPPAPRLSNLFGGSGPAVSE